MIQIWLLIRSFISRNSIQKYSAAVAVKVIPRFFRKEPQMNISCFSPTLMIISCSTSQYGHQFSKILVKMYIDCERPASVISTVWALSIWASAVWGRWLLLPAWVSKSGQVPSRREEVLIWGAITLFSRVRRNVLPGKQTKVFPRTHSTRQVRC